MALAAFLIAACVAAEPSAEPAADPIAAPTTVPGRFGEAWSCAADAPALAVAHETALEPALLTLEAWIRVDALPDDAAVRALVGKNGDASTPGHYGLYLSGDKLGAAIDGEGAGAATLAFSTDRLVRAGQWHHAAMTWDGRVLKVYLDGAPAAAVVIDRSRSRGDGALAIGSGVAAIVDEVVLWDRALPRAEVAAHAAGERAHAADPGLVRRWTGDPQ
ncbi:MAG TPA: LamG domain-containing protein [Planctomycetota bacterium]|nr:LamG domain-containing protein [Planctomycetota bacterium]